MGTTIDPSSTLDALIREARARLAKTDIADPRRDAETIACWAIGVEPLEVWTQRRRPVDRATRQRFTRAVDRRAEGVPLAYVIGTAAFRHVELLVDERVLIPRPETEGLVEHVLAFCSRGMPCDRTLAALEIGVGSGCVVSSLALEGRFGRMVGTDMSRDALAVAQQNVDRFALANRIELRYGQFFEPVRGERFDVIVSNPPYVTPTEYATLDAGVREFEPEVALVSTPDGLEHIRQLCAGATRHLNPGGFLALEIDSRRASEALEIARDAGFEDAHIERDLFGRSRYLLAIWPPSGEE